MMIQIWDTPPVGQPRSCAISKAGRTWVYEPSGPIKDWKEAVMAAVMKQWGDYVFEEGIPVQVAMTFYCKSAKKDKLPYELNWDMKKPDIDNLVKSTLDAVVKTGKLHDDNQVVELHAEKYLRQDRRVGAMLTFAPAIYGCLRNPQ
jgi:Holliday junction resolvase RusA-like endonuclease